MANQFNMDKEKFDALTEETERVESDFLKFKQKADNAIKIKIPQELKMKQESLNEQKRNATKM